MSVLAAIGADLRYASRALAYSASGLITRASTAPPVALTGTGYGSQGLAWENENLGSGTQQEYVSTYQRLVWVYAGVYAIAAAGASIWPRLHLQGRRGEPSEIIEHDVLDLLANPNTYQTYYDFMEMNWIYLELGGDLYWELEPDAAGNPVAVYPLMTHRMTIIPGTTAERPVEKYAYETNSGPQYYAPEQIVHIKYANPLSDFYGQGSVQAAEKAIIAELYAREYNNRLFENMGRPDFVFELPPGKTMDDATWRRTLRQWMNRYGGVTRGHKPGLLQAGMKLKTLTWKHTDLMFAELLKLNREEILGSLGVTPVMVGLTDGINYANAREQRRVFWESGMTPRLAKMAAQITTAFLRRIDPRLYLEYDLSTVPALQEELFEQAKAAVTLVRGRVWAPNEARRRLWAMPPYENGDLILGAGTLIPHGQAEQKAAGLAAAIIGRVPPVGEQVVYATETTVGGTRAVVIPSDYTLQNTRLRIRPPGRGVVRANHRRVIVLPNKPPVRHRHGGRGGRSSLALHSGHPAAVNREADLADIERTGNAAARRWVRWMRRAATWEAKIIAILKDLYARQEQEVLERLRDVWPVREGAPLPVAPRAGNLLGGRRVKPGDPLVDPEWLAEEVLFDEEEWQATFRDSIGPVALAALEDEAKRTLVELGIGADEFDVWAPGVQETLEQTEFRFSFHLNATTRERLRDALREAHTEGLTMAETAERLNFIYDGRRDNSILAARTEMTGLMNGGGYQGARQSGVCDRKEWITAADELVRGTDSEDEANHVAMNGVVVKLDEPFVVPPGEDLAYPGVVTASAAQRCNCRCTTLWLTVKEAPHPPPGEGA